MNHTLIRLTQEEKIAFLKENNQPRDYNWYRTTVPIKQWNNYYSKCNYTLLSSNTKEATIGFCAVHVPHGCLEITEYEDLKKIDAHRRMINYSPYPLVDIKT